MMIKVTLNSKELLKKVETEVLTAMAFKKTRKVKVDLVLVRTLQPVQFNFGPFFPMDENSMAAYYMTLTDTWVNSILLF